MIGSRAAGTAISRRMVIAIGKESKRKIQKFYSKMDDWRTGYEV